MAQKTRPSTHVDLKGFIDRSTEGAMARPDAERFTDDASSYLNQFKHEGASLQKSWSTEKWGEVNAIVDRFCEVSLRLNRSIGGLQVRAFEEASRVLGSFVEYAEDLLQDATQNNLLPSDEVLNNILGVVERCKLRISELEEKRADIDVYRKKIQEITDP